MKSYCKGLAMDRAHFARAYEAWRRGESGRRNAWRVERDHGSAGALVGELAEEVRERRLSLEPIRRYERTEPTNGKVRTIGIESVKQQVLDYAVVLALRPMLDARVGRWQVAGVPGRGQLAARDAMRRWVREGGYHAKADVRKCYPSISADVVMRILRKYVRSDDVLYCAGALLATYGGGLEIGSYFSLCMANLVLSFAYHHVEGLHKVRRGRRVALVTHQLWHMDDALLTSRSKRDLRVAMRSLERYMRDELGLSLKGWKVSRTSDAEPLDMGGFRVRRRRTTLRARLFLRARRAFARFRRRRTLRLAYRVVSYWGWLAHADCDGYIRRNGLGGLFRSARGVVSRAGRGQACPSTT